MITLRDRRTNNLFDPWESLGPKRRKLLDRCWAGIFRNYLLEHLPEVLFDQSRCSRCPDRQKCPGYANRQGRTIRRWQYTLARVAQYRRRLAEQSEEFKERYRWRAGVEATMSRLKYQMVFSALRVRGRLSVKYAVYLKALGLNIRRVAACTTCPGEKSVTRRNNTPVIALEGISGFQFR
jgi:hypothetical protein